MPKFRKKPIVIEAVQWTGENVADLTALVADDRLFYRFGGPEITTPEGKMRVSKGDWVIRGVAGEVYPCKPDIFAATYEAV